MSALPLVTSPAPLVGTKPKSRQQANELVHEYIAHAREPGLYRSMECDADAYGQPREDIWVEDRIHPNHAGYLDSRQAYAADAGEGG